jgi:hypothetical protein
VERPLDLDSVNHGAGPYARSKSLTDRGQTLKR